MLMSEISHYIIDVERTVLQYDILAQSLARTEVITFVSMTDMPENQTEKWMNQMNALRKASISFLIFLFTQKSKMAIISHSCSCNHSHCLCSVIPLPCVPRLRSSCYLYLLAFVMQYNLRW